MTFSSIRTGNIPAPISGIPDETLEQAQSNKKHHIASKLLIEPDMRVLDIGCGWGGMALTLARDYGARVVGVTLSREQHAVATARAEAAGLSGRVDFRLMDYRHVAETFDRDRVGRHVRACRRAAFPRVFQPREPDAEP